MGKGYGGTAGDLRGFGQVWASLGWGYSFPLLHVRCHTSHGRAQSDQSYLFYSRIFSGSPPGSHQDSMHTHGEAFRTFPDRMLFASPTST